MKTKLGPWGLLLALVTGACAHGEMLPASDDDDGGPVSGTGGGGTGGTTSSSTTSSGTGGAGGATTSSSSSSSVSSSSSSSVASSSSASSGSGGGGVCDNQSNCDNCMNCSVGSVCATQANTCLADLDCNDFLDCLNNCFDDVCANQCVSDHPSGANLYFALLDCALCTACTNDCAFEGQGFCI